MARIRSIKPEFCKSEVIATLPLELRLHFIVLWTYADDEGRGVDNPKLIKAELWPLDDAVGSDVVDEWQDELERAGRIVRYFAGGRRYFQIVNFEEHQHPQKPTPSKLPDPPTTTTGDVPEQDATTTGDVPPVVVVVDGEVVVDVVGASATPAAPDKTGRSDALFEAVAEVCSIDWRKGLTKSARGALNAAVGELRLVGADPATVRTRAARYARDIGEDRLTPHALAKHWPQLERDRATRSNGQPQSAGVLERAAERMVR